ncbi:MAG TPA: hypothetical protein VHW09_27140 [Bryobacteraceae bacterium]|jgi:hypothetical protein|nr:hypothetical protein [Bryobacteraceae bacterium]
MPNWTSNRIYIEGERADIRAFLKAVKWEDELFDFNRIAPMPEILKHTASGHTTINGVAVKSWYVVKEWEKDSPEQTRLFTAEEEAELAAIGHRDWYSWSIQNWGTKWNACSVDIDDASVEYGYTEITFNTAWDAPIPLLHKMVEMFPKLTFDCRWRHEDDSPYPHSLDDHRDNSVSAILALAGAS